MNFKSTTTQSLEYLLAIGAATISVAGMAWIMEDRGLAVAAAVLSVYLLHLLSIRYILRAQKEQWEMLRDLVGDGELGQQPPPSQELAEASAGTGTTTAGGHGAPESSAPPPGADREPRGSEAKEDRPGEAGKRGEAGAQERTAEEEVPVPRKFALGTVSLIKKKLEPSEVAEILLIQRRRPGSYFGEVALEMGFLTSEELAELRQEQRKGLFTDSEVREARRRLEAFREKRARKE